MRRRLWEGGAAAVAASADPMIAFVRATDPLSRAAREMWEDDVVGPGQRAQRALARARAALGEAQTYPDASFSLRLSYGRVPSDGDAAEPAGPVTRLAGLFARAGADGREPLPADWTAAQPALDPATVLDFVTTNDITAGSSGSPVVSSDQRLLGAIFDGNAASLGGPFAYDAARNRAIAVSTAAIAAALSTVYGRTDLMAELRAGAQPAAAATLTVR